MDVGLVKRVDGCKCATGRAAGRSRFGSAPTDQEVVLSFIFKPRPVSEGGRECDGRVFRRDKSDEVWDSSSGHTYVTSSLGIVKLSHTGGNPWVEGGRRLLEPDCPAGAGWWEVVDVPVSVSSISS